MGKRRVVIVGGGVIGLSLAWKLSQRDVEVTVVDRNRMAKKASWAGAGILSPANFRMMTQPLDKLMGLGNDLHARWADELREETGIDNGFRRCGGIYIARSPGERAALFGLKTHWEQYEIAFESIEELSTLRELDTERWGKSAIAIRVPGESQICNPDHLKALIVACKGNNVLLRENSGPVGLFSDNEKIDSIMLGDKQLGFDQICLCAGAWSTELVKQLDVHLPVAPVRGQMLLYKLQQKLFDPIINEGSRYIVPRDDGHVLVGSTTEEVGFDESTTDDKLNELKEFAHSVVSGLTEERMVRSWAGLRPASYDGFPFMGRVPNFDNVFVSTGHFKAGLQMSTAAAELMADAMEGRQTTMDIRVFDPARLHKERSFDPETHRV